jgi:sugar phosphate isomerase/epimerase
MNTIKLLKQKITFIAFFLFVQGLEAQEIGLQLYSLREQFKVDVPGTLAKIKSWNIREIEGGGTYGLPINEYKKLLSQNGLEMVSIGTSYQQLATDPQLAIDEAKAFGAKYIVCHWIPHKGDVFTKAEMDSAIQVFTRAGKKIRESGLQLCYHPHGYEFSTYNGGTLFDYMVNSTSPEYLNFEMDVFWIKHPGQDPVALLNKYPSRFVLMHIKDRRPGTEGNPFGRANGETNVVLGQGDIGIAEVMQAAKKLGIKHYFIEDESSRVETQIPQSIQYLKQLK